MSRDRIDEYFEKYKNYYENRTIIYAKGIAKNIDKSDILREMFEGNDIDIMSFINEISYLSNFKLVNYGDEKLAIEEIQNVLDYIVFSNELEKQIMLDNVSISSIGENGTIFYKANEYAVEYFLDEFGIEMPENEEFDITSINGEDGEGGEEDFNARLN